EGWYRIPQRKAPRRIGADYLAFYQTGAFGEKEEAQTVTYYAPTRRYRLVTRRELLPTEADHPRSEEYYFRIELGPLQRLARPIPAQQFRRVTFIHTSFHHLLTAERVSDLFYKDDPFERLWNSLREYKLRPLKNRLVGERPIDITLRARGGYLGIQCSDEIRTEEPRPLLLAERWEFLSLSQRALEQDLPGCLRQIGAALITLGGSNLNLTPDD
ncbi:MAG: hypothetical protein KDE31_30165, partial [Caldilineaceae bacterium]|nr:hypothetical protein [Caldilineaceae bacterium]